MQSYTASDGHLYEGCIRVALKNHLHYLYLYLQDLNNLRQKPNEYEFDGLYRIDAQLSHRWIIWQLHSVLTNNSNIPNYQNYCKKSFTSNANGTTFLIVESKLSLTHDNAVKTMRKLEAAPMEKLVAELKAQNYQVDNVGVILTHSNPHTYFLNEGWENLSDGPIKMICRGPPQTRIAVIGDIFVKFNNLHKKPS